MNPFQTCRDGDCDPHSCPICLNTCNACGLWLIEFTCPTLPLDGDRP